MTEITLNAVTLSTAVPELLVVKVSRPLVGDRRDQFVEVPGRSGSWAFRELPGDRVFRIEFDILAPTFELRRDAVRRLADWADTPAGQVRMIIGDEPDRYHLAMLAEAPTVVEWLTRGTGELSYRVGPYALDLVDGSAIFNATASPFSQSVTIAEDVEVYPVLEVTPTNGTITALDLGFEEGPLSWAGLILSGDTLTISSISDTITAGVSTDVNLTGAFNGAAVQMTDAAGIFPILAPGSNPFTFTWAGTATTVTFEFTWQRRYR